MLPVLIRQLREKPYPLSNIQEFLARARSELEARQSDLTLRQERFKLQRRSRTDLKFTDSCFDSEQRSLVYAFEALNGLEAFLKSKDAAHLGEALADFGVAELHFEQLIRLRKRLPAWLQEDLQRAA